MSAISMESLTFKDFVSKGQFEVYKSTLHGDHLARAAVEIMQRIRDAGVDHDKWLQDLKVASGWEEDPLKLLQAIAASTKKLIYNHYTTIGHAIHACSRRAMMSKDWRCPPRHSTEGRQWEAHCSALHAPWAFVSIGPGRNL